MVLIIGNNNPDIFVLFCLIWFHFTEGVYAEVLKAQQNKKEKKQNAWKRMDSSHEKQNVQLFMVQETLTNITCGLKKKRL